MARYDKLKGGIYVENLAEFSAMLEKLPKGYDSKFLTKVLKQGIKPMQQSANNKAPIGNAFEGDPHPGLLADSVKMWSFTKSKHTGMFLGIKKGSPDTKMTTAYYAGMVEYGTVKMKAQPFMRPAWDQNKGKSEAIILSNFKRKFEQEVKRLTKKGLM